MSPEMEAVMRAVECVGAFFLIGYLGYWLTKKGWFSNESADMLTRLVTMVIIPVALLYTINTSTTQESFFPHLKFILLPAASIILTMIATALLLKVVKIPKKRRNIVITASACSNTINIGLPINLALFGTDSLPAILVYYMGNTVIFWTFGNYLLASDSETAVKTPLASRETLRKIFPPAIQAFVAGMILLLFDVKLPGILTLAGRQIGGMLTPTAILCIGIAIWQTGIRNIRFDRGVALIAFGRFVLSPLVILALMRLMPVPRIMHDVFIIQASLPPMMNIALMARRFKSDAGFASVAISLCTLCALVTVPVFMLILSYL